MDRLIPDLENDPMTSFVVLYGQYDTNLLTIKTKKKTMNNSVEIDNFTEDLGDNEDNPEQFARDTKSKSELVNSANGKVALAIAWTNEEARRKLNMYPEFLGGGVLVLEVTVGDVVKCNLVGVAEFI